MGKVEGHLGRSLLARWRNPLTRVYHQSKLWGGVFYFGIVIYISRNGLLKSCARFVIERSEIRKNQHDFKSVHFECYRIVLGGPETD